MVDPKNIIPMKSIVKTLMILPLLLSLAACDKDDPISRSQVLTAEIKCKYTMSPDQLRYFDYILKYTDDEGYDAYLIVDQPTIELNLVAPGMPNERFFKFEVTRNNTPPPAERVNWEQTFDVEIVRNYIDGHTDTITAKNTTTYNPSPDEFERWATQQYIPLMAQGYEVYINYAGNVNFSFD